MGSAGVPVENNLIPGQVEKKSALKTNTFNAKQYDYARRRSRRTSSEDSSQTLSKSLEISRNLLKSLEISNSEILELFSRAPSNPSSLELPRTLPLSSYLFFFCFLVSSFVESKRL
eukprot:1380325-Amorphochlora_amoeboformis.AAC.1